MIDYFLADDLSGALDAAAAFHHVGRRVRIALSHDRWAVEDGDDVIGVTTETRNSPASVAADVVTRAIAHGHAQGARLVYKKIDSTLRGSVAAELAALATALPRTRILFTPANPRVGRTVREGVLLVHGVPVAQTEFAHDPVSPVRHSVIRALLGESVMERVTIADAESEADLEVAVNRMEAGGVSWVGVGSGALARPVAARFTGTVKSRANVAANPSRGVALMVCGSTHAGNRAQASRLGRERGVSLHVVPTLGGNATVTEAIAALRAGRGVMLMAEEPRGDSAAILGAITKAAREILAATGVNRVFVTGGETAHALCRALEVNSLGFEAEIEAGLSLSRAEGTPSALRFAIKPGGFGDTETWIRAWDLLTKP